MNIESTILMNLFPLMYTTGPLGTPYAALTQLGGTKKDQFHASRYNF